MESKLEKRAAQEMQALLQKMYDERYPEKVRQRELDAEAKKLGLDDISQEARIAKKEGRYDYGRMQSKGQDTVAEYRTNRGIQRNPEKSLGSQMRAKKAADESAEQLFAETGRRGIEDLNAGTASEQITSHPRESLDYLNKEIDRLGGLHDEVAAGRQFENANQGLANLVQKGAGESAFRHKLPGFKDIGLKRGLMGLGEGGAAALGALGFMGDAYLLADGLAPEAANAGEEKDPEYKAHLLQEAAKIKKRGGKTDDEILTGYNRLLSKSQLP